MIDDDMKLTWKSRSSIPGGGGERGVIRAEKKEAVPLTGFGSELPEEGRKWAAIPIYQLLSMLNFPTWMS